VPITTPAIAPPDRDPDDDCVCALGLWEGVTVGEVARVSAGCDFLDEVDEVVKLGGIKVDEIDEPDEVDDAASVVFDPDNGGYVNPIRFPY
jgi:hypothetical protein